VLFTLRFAEARAAQVHELDRRKQILNGNVQLAQVMARFVFTHLSTPVVETAWRPELRELLEKQDRDGLHRFVQQVHEANEALARALSPQPGATSPCASWYILDTAGRLLAVAPPNPRIVDKLYSGRDYFQGIMKQAGQPDRSAVHISRIYRSENNDLDKFAISAPVRAGPAADAPVVGVVVATLTTAPALGPLVTQADEHLVVLAGRKDVNPARGDNIAADGEAEYVIMAHPGHKWGQPAVKLDNARVRNVGQSSARSSTEMDPDYLDPMAERDPRYGGRWLAGLAPVGNTDFVVIVQERYGAELVPERPLAREPVLWIAVALGMLFVAGVVWYGIRARPR
jgi:hypothetical protein